MKTNTSSDLPSDSLRVWQVSPPPDPAFRPAVWAQIASTVRRRQESWWGYCRRHALLWGLVFLVGTAGAGLHGQRVGVQHRDEDHRAMVGTYLAEIDARAMLR